MVVEGEREVGFVGGEGERRGGREWTVGIEFGEKEGAGGGMGEVGGGEGRHCWICVFVHCRWLLAERRFFLFCCCVCVCVLG